MKLYKEKLSSKPSRTKHLIPIYIPDTMESNSQQYNFIRRQHLKTYGNTPNKTRNTHLDSTSYYLSKLTYSNTLCKRRSSNKDCELINIFTKHKRRHPVLPNLKTVFKRSAISKSLQKNVFRDFIVCSSITPISIKSSICNPRTITASKRFSLNPYPSIDKCNKVIKIFLKKKSSLVLNKVSNKNSLTKLLRIKARLNMTTKYKV